MKAVIANRAGGPEVLSVVEIEEAPLEKGEVKIEVQAFGLNKAESYYRSGNYGTFVPGRAPGIEAVGVVLEDTTGSFQAGDRVATAMGGMMFGRHGGYAQIITVNAENVVAITSGLEIEVLASLPESYLTVWGALDKNLGIKAGQSLLVRGGTSAVGQAAITYAKARGLHVLATTRKEAGVAGLKAIGADHVMIDDGEIHERVRAILPLGVDNALEVVGAATLRDTLKSVKAWGQVTVIGLLGGPPVLNQFNLMGDLPNTVKLSFFSSGLLGSVAMPLHDSPLDWVAHQVNDGHIPRIVARVFEVEDIQEAHRLLDAGTAGGKIVVRF